MARIQHLRSEHWPSAFMSAKRREGSAFSLPGDLDEAWEAVRECDPSATGKHMSWLLGLLLTGGVHTEDLGRVCKTLDLYGRFRSRLPEDRRSLSAYATEAGLSEALSPFVGSTGSREARRGERAEVMSETDVLYDGPEGMVVSPKTERAARFWGRGTRWCTSADKQNAFETYARRGSLLISVPRGRKAVKHQVHARSRSLADASDRRVDPFALLEQQPWLKEVPEFVAALAAIDIGVAKLRPPCTGDEWAMFVEHQPALAGAGLLGRRAPPSAVMLAGEKSDLLAALSLVRTYGPGSVLPWTLSGARFIEKQAIKEKAPGGERWTLKLRSHLPCCKNSMLDLFGPTRGPRRWLYWNKNVVLYLTPEGDAVTAEDHTIWCPTSPTYWKTGSFHAPVVTLRAMGRRSAPEPEWFFRNKAFVRHWPQLTQHVLQHHDRRMIEEIGIEPSRKELEAAIPARPEILTEWVGLKPSRETRSLVFTARPHLAGWLPGGLSRYEHKLVEKSLVDREYASSWIAKLPEEVVEALLPSLSSEARERMLALRSADAPVADDSLIGSGPEFEEDPDW
jgi:hypothetical protein